MGRILPSAKPENIIYIYISEHCLHAHDKRKLNGFHTDCCRKILRTGRSHISRVSNRYVSAQLGTTPLTSILLKRQLHFLGSVATRAHNDPIRNLLFQPRAYTQAKVAATRRRSRPRLGWDTVMHNHAIEVAKPRAIASITCVKEEWRKAVNAYCATLAGFRGGEMSARVLPE